MFLLEAKTSSKTILEDAMNFLADFEGFRELAYWDVSRWSIGYGTRGYQGERITREEAKRRKIEYIRPIYEAIPDCFNDNQKIAIISYKYNTGNPLNLDYRIRNCDTNGVLYVMRNWGYTANGVVLRGLVNRRNIEINKFNN